MAQGQCRPYKPRPVEGDVGDRELPHGGARRACCTLRELRAHHHRLQQLPQPALPQVPGCGSAGMAGRARGRAVAGAVLSRGVHAAGSDRRHRLSEQGGDLRPAVQGIFRDHAHNRSRPQAPWRTHRRSIRPPYLGLSAQPSSACAHDRAGRRHLARRQQVGRLPAALLIPVRSALAIVPPAVSARSLSPRTGPESCSSSASTPHSLTAKRFLRFWRRCATSNGTSTASLHSAVPSKCYAIWRAIPIASPSPTGD